MNTEQVGKASNAGADNAGMKHEVSVSWLLVTSIIVAALEQMSLESLSAGIAGYPSLYLMEAGDKSGIEATIGWSVKH